MDPFAHFPTPSPPINPACVPGYCSGQPRTSVSSAKVQKVLQAFLEWSRYSLLLNLMLVQEAGLMRLLKELTRSMVNPEIDSKENESLVAEFRTATQLQLMEAWARFEPTDYETAELNLLAPLSALLDEIIGGTCYCTLSQSESLLALEEGGQLKGAATVTSYFLWDEKLFQDLVIGWNPAHVMRLCGFVGVVMLGKLEAIARKSELERYHLELSRTSTLSKQIVFDRINEASSSLHHARLVAQKLKNETQIPELLELMKLEADKVAAEKKYDEALKRYGIVNILRGPDSCKSLLVQSFANSAALRLRLASENALHLPNAILDCTLALEIEPNHVKALFRRGLALALLKKWNEAIVDFERAVELDPRSPAVKELAVARRQVTRRIGA